VKQLEQLEQRNELEKALGLKVTDVDSQRMLIHARAGAGAVFNAGSRFARLDGTFLT
jgi:hypothetical protein